MNQDRGEKKRKARSENRQRQKRFFVRVTDEECAAITAKAEASGLSIAGFLRACALGKVTANTKRCVPYDCVILERTIVELRRVGNNINQIARAANMNQPTDAAKLRHALNEHMITLQRLREARRM